MTARLLQATNDFIDARGGGEGYFGTPVPGMHVIRAFYDVPAHHHFCRPSLCIVVQGSKRISIGEETLEYGAMQCLIMTVEQPACGRILGASPDLPFVGISIDIDPALMHEVIEQLDLPPRVDEDVAPKMFVAPVEEPLTDCIAKLFRLFSDPKSVRILAPSVLREMYFWLLNGPDGGKIWSNVVPESRIDRLASSIQLMRENYNRTLRVEQLAQAARMSASSFHQHFKKLTSLTPLQYQKQLRLLEARRLMLAESLNAGEAAYRVGYGSVSQFSREYSRMFGVTPKRSVGSVTQRSLPAMQATNR